MNNCHVSCEVFIMAPQLWESLVVFYRITRGKVTQQIISLSTHGPQHIYACGKFMFTLTLDKQSFLAELVRATQTHFWIRQVTFQEWSCWHDHMIFCSSTSAFVNFLSAPMWHICKHIHVGVSLFSSIIIQFKFSESLHLVVSYNLPKHLILIISKSAWITSLSEIR